MRTAVRRAEATSEFETRERCYILDVANDEGDDEMSIARARVPAGISTEWHQLTDTDERYIIVSGKGRVEVAGIEPAEVQPGDVVRIPANTPQRITNTGGEDLTFFCVCTPRFDAECYVALPDVERQPAGDDRRRSDRT
jgi:mannose-6-phosphate isomerase-like protein (cupin superfamily)